jgi:uncharacterized protein
MNNRSLSTVIVKPCDDLCDMACDYCYFLNKAKPLRKKSLMDEVTLQNLVRFFCEGQTDTEFIWHGGEPLLAGLDFYQTAIDFQAEWKNRGVTIKNSIQTNATLLDGQWARFFEHHQFSVGVSCDGPVDIHNIHRRYRSGKPSFANTLKGIKLLQATDVFSGVLCCVHQGSLENPRKILDFFIENGIKDIRFLRVKGADIFGRPMPGLITPMEFSNFLKELFWYWIEIDDPSVEITNFKSLTELMLGGQFRECTLAGECYKYATVYSNGSIYPCDTLPQNESTYFGNVAQSRNEVLKSSTFLNFLRRHEIVRSGCQSCGWRSVCMTGCLADWQGESLDLHNQCCDGVKSTFQEVKKALQLYQLI